MEKSFKQKALAWADTFDVCAVLDTNAYPDTYHQYDLLIAAGAAAEIREQAGHAFDKLKNFYEQHHNWMFGMLSYDLKNEVEALHSLNPDPLDFPDLYFFVPQYLIAVSGATIDVLLGPQEILHEIENTAIREFI